MFLKQLHKGSPGFTLAELLVTIVIIGIMLAVALPALTGISAASRLDGAAHTLHSAVKMARQHAATRKQPTYILFHDHETTSDPNLVYRSYAVFTIDIHQQPVDQSSGSFLLDWQPLPTGIVFDNQTTENQNNIFISGKNAWNAGYGRNNLLKVNATVYPVLAFSPEGTNLRDYLNDIYLTEGMFDATGRLKRTSPRGIRIRTDSAGRGRITTVYYDTPDHAEAVTR